VARYGCVTVTALLVAAGGFVLQMASGVTNTPTVPPGLVTLLVAAGLVALLSWWWMPVVGSVAGLFNLIAFVVIGAVGRLVEPRILAVFHFPLLVDKVGHVIGLGFGVVLPLMVFSSRDHANSRVGRRGSARLLWAALRGRMQTRAWCPTTAACLAMASLVRASTCEKVEWKRLPYGYCNPRQTPATYELPKPGSA
jgi:hypothetical protein